MGSFMLNTGIGERERERQRERERISQIGVCQTTSSSSFIIQIPNMGHGNSLNSKNKHRAKFPMSSVMEAIGHMFTVFVEGIVL